MTGDKPFGSDVLTEDEFVAADSQHEEILETFYKAIQERDQAKEFLATPFGISLRKSLVSESLKTMKACAENSDPAKHAGLLLDYNVIQKVQNIFGLIISDGDAALRQLQVRRGDENDY
ncbi:MAG: hypothetical protein DRQ42_05845 [Gammaproteobacteria bacterium]|nr:MAG: hypothetical protein DRQ42_05845 [Gammaproteobacteria bacterium]